MVVYAQLAICGRMSLGQNYIVNLIPEKQSSWKSKVVIVPKSVLIHFGALIDMYMVAALQLYNIYSIYIPYPGHLVSSPRRNWSQSLITSLAAST